MSKEIVFIHSGLGNQMFQYAFYLAKKHNNPNTRCNMGLLKNRKVHNGFELEKIFGIKIPNYHFHTFLLRVMYYSKLIEKILKTIGIKEITDRSYHSNNNKALVKYFSGYWQTEQHFSHIKKEIRKAFQFPVERLNDESQEIAKMITHCNSISIHIRRGDYTRPQFVGIYGNICTLDYYVKAINKSMESVDNPTYFVFSDDIDWVKQNLKIPNPIYVNCNKGNDSWQDMYLMSICKHNITANSTFSWWGAWLNANPDKKVFCPPLFDNVNASPNIFPEHWIKIH